MKLSYNISRFRSIIDNQTIELNSEKINIIIGTNGSGKSNVLDSIRWFSGHNIKNIKSKKTEFHPDFNNSNLYLEDTEIIYEDLLNEIEKNQVIDHLKKINIDYNPKSLSRHFGKYKDLFYKELNISKNDLTDLTKINEKIVSKYKENWPNGIFVEEKINQYKFWKLNMDIENAKNEIKNSTKKGLTKEIKNLLCLSIDKWIEIEKIFKIRPNILFSNNLEIDNNILFEYPIQSIKNIETLDPTFKKILNMFGQDTIKNIEQIINLSTSDSNRTNIRSLKDKLARQAKKCFTNIFKNFTVNVIPEIVIDDQMFQIIIRGKENRYFSTSETIYQSSGFKAFLWLIIMLEVVKDWDKNRYGRAILLVDEPDKSLHILLQYELANYLKLNFTNNNNVFILMTSHSPFLIPNLNENIYIADMNEEGKTTLIKAKNVNNIRNSGIFPLITLFHMEKLRDELFENIKEDLIRIYFENQKNDDLNKKIENFIHNIILNKFNYSLIQINNAEQKHINEIRTHEMFSKFIYNIDDLYKLITDEHIKTKKDIYLTEKFIKSILSDDILNSINKSKE